MAQIPFAEQPLYVNGDPHLVDRHIYTTLPTYLSANLTVPLMTQHLIIRALDEGDRELFISLFLPGTIQDVIINSYQRDFTPDELFDVLLPEVQQDYNPCAFLVFARTPHNTQGEFMGFVGVDSDASSIDNDPPYRITHWPGLRLKIKREYLREYGLEIIQAYLGFWWGRPRTRAEAVNPVTSHNLVNDARLLNPPLDHYPELFTATCLPEARWLLQGTGFDFVRRLNNGQEVWCDWKRD
ncbi:hypothetical protein CDD80_5477 [Ophiocordyceps camponoti-rufipedis]|uniref:N-acetyltransferase domain-containing protein n=1 Tax=Ophiocordyceps camponoti-rufipedis TaxID=2004952 RepID=A0A2C5YV08_9HYPO|nr:hypothetical protein CDD80_5477 [Ophiocordyceps camponoti-rufipedis]